MIAYEVYLNGEKICVAGGRALTAVTGSVNYFPNRPDQLGPLLTVGAMVDQKEYLQWAHQSLRAGDKVEIRVVDLEEVDAPVRRDPIPPNE